jgi:hypothetical protein
MILYVNGDSHSVGHGINSPDGLTTNDTKYQHIDEAPHPDNLPDSYGALLANRLNADFVCQARSGGSLDRAIRTTKQFVYQTRGKLFVVLGIPSIEREEWFHEGIWYQINASGHEILPKELQYKYKKWVANWSQAYDYYGRQIKIHQKLVEFHEWLNQHSIAHLFFYTVQGCQPDNRFDQYDWSTSFINPYSDTPNDCWNYHQYLTQKGYIVDSWGHHGKGAHQEFANFLYQYIQQHQLI